jgi:hypothetical protein
MLGGTILRQHNLIFDIEKSQLGVVKATCSPDPLQIKKQHELIERGQTLGFFTQDPDSTECDDRSHGNSPFQHVPLVSIDEVGVEQPDIEGLTEEEIRTQEPSNEEILKVESDFHEVVVIREAPVH